MASAASAALAVAVVTLPEPGFQLALQPESLPVPSYRPSVPPQPFQTPPRSPAQPFVVPHHLLSLRLSSTIAERSGVPLDVLVCHSSHRPDDLVSLALRSLTVSSLNSARLPHVLSQQRLRRCPRTALYLRQGFHRRSRMHDARGLSGRAYRVSASMCSPKRFLATRSALSTSGTSQVLPSLGQRIIIPVRAHRLGGVPPVRRDGAENPTPFVVGGDDFVRHASANNNLVFGFSQRVAVRPERRGSLGQDNVGHRRVPL